MSEGGIRGEVFCDRLGACTEILLAGSSFGITVFRKNFGLPDAFAAALYGVEILGAFLIMRSRLAPMRIALWLFAFRVLAGIGYLGAVHGDKLARSTLGFPIVVLAYCILRVRTMKREQELL